MIITLTQLSSAPKSNVANLSWQSYYMPYTLFEYMKSLFCCYVFSHTHSGRILCREKNKQAKNCHTWTEKHIITTITCNKFQRWNVNLNMCLKKRIIITTKTINSTERSGTVKKKWITNWNILEQIYGLSHDPWGWEIV